MASYEELQARALKIRDKYDQLNQKQRGVTWGPLELTAGMVGDLGDLMKIIMARQGLRAMEDIDKKLAHELADVQWVLFVLAKRCGIDLEASFINTMNELEERIDREMNG